MASLQDMSDAELEAEINRLQELKQFSDKDLNANIAQEAHNTGQAAGLSEDEIKRNYALQVAQRGEEPTTLFGMKQLPSWVPYLGGKPATTTATAAPDPALGTVGNFAQGLPVAGAAVPDLPSMDWLKREHPVVAKAANTAGFVAGAVPAMAMGPPGVVGAVTMGGLVSGGDAAARQVYDPNAMKFDPSKFDPDATAREIAIGSAAGLGGKLLSRAVSPTSRIPDRFQFPRFEHLPQGLQDTVGAASVIGAAAPKALTGDWWGVLRNATEAGLGHAYATPRVYDLARVPINRMIANRANPAIQDTINALFAGQKPSQ